MLVFVMIVLGCSLAGMTIAKLWGRKEYTWQEMTATVGISVLVCSMLLAAGTYSSMYDTAVINGQVTSKERNKVHCRHSYDCRCRIVTSGSGNNKTSHRECDTCYDHSYDIDWIVNTTVGNHDIDTIDRQGLQEPPRWTSTVIGEPAHSTQMYTNYIKGAPESLFNKALLMQNKYPIPAYPDNVTDYYRINRVVEVGVVVKEKVKLNQELNMILRTLGPSKQVNIVPVFTSYDANFARALEAAWLGGKKNDVVIVVGLSPDQKINWTYVFSWSKQSFVNYAIKDGIVDMGTLDVTKYVEVVNTNITKSFTRKSMKEFEYLQNDMSPPTWCIVLAMVLAFFGSLIAGYYLSKPTGGRYGRY